MLEAAQVSRTRARAEPACDPLAHEARDPGGPSRLAEQFWPLFDGLRRPAGLLLAVSGGPDSTALMHLAAGWARNAGGPPLAVACVDHGLRPESAAEAEGVVRAAQALGLPAERLVWSADKPDRGLAERARIARYELLTDHARRIGASHLLTGHTLDDQAETVLMRLSRGSGVAGAAAMRPTVDRDGIALVRPLLGVRKAALVALCQANGWPFVDDPSNRNPASTRVRWRRLAPVLAAEGLSAERLARFAARSARADDALQRIAEAARRGAALPPDGAAVRLRVAALVSQPDEILLRVIGGAVGDVGHRTLLRLDRLETLADALRTASDQGIALRRTLGGCVVALEDGVLTIGPEAPRRRGRAALAATSGAVGEAAPFTLTGRSLGNGTPASYIPDRDATARGADAVETHCASCGDARDVLLSTGRQ